MQTFPAPPMWAEARRKEGEEKKEAGAFPSC